MTLPKHDPAQSRLFAGNAHFRRRGGQIAGSGRQSGACGAGGVVNQEAVERWLEVRSCGQASVSRRGVRRAGEEVLV